MKECLVDSEVIASLSLSPTAPLMCGRFVFPSTLKAMSTARTSAGLLSGRYYGAIVVTECTANRGRARFTGLHSGSCKIRRRSRSKQTSERRRRHSRSLTKEATTLKNFTGAASTAPTVTLTTALNIAGNCLLASVAVTITTGQGNSVPGGK